MNIAEYSYLEPIAEKLHENHFKSTEVDRIRKETGLDETALGNLLVILDAWEAEESADRMTEYDLTDASVEQLKQWKKDIEADDLILPRDKECMYESIDELIELKS